MPSRQVQANLRIERIYLRKLVFEIFNTPDLYDQKWLPDVKVDMNVTHKIIGEGRYEVVISANVEAQLNRKPVLQLKIEQAGMFHVGGVKEGTSEMNQLLMVVCSNMLFPYVREAIDNITVRGALPPFALAPVNFEALVRQAIGERKNQLNITEDTVLN